MLEALFYLLRAWPIDIMIGIIIGGVIVADIYDKKEK